MIERVKPDYTERLNKITKINEDYPSMRFKMNNNKYNQKLQIKERQTIQWPNEKDKGIYKKSLKIPKG
jgi:hypothetical protein